jgi:hypothetical protein
MGFFERTFFRCKRKIADSEIGNSFWRAFLESTLAKVRELSK